jgi:hypothetical protein
MTLAPIALFAYNRLWHTRQTVEALQKNELALQSELIVFSDGPRTEADREKVRSVRNYLKTIAGFRIVIIVERDENLGLAQSIITGVTEIVNRYGRIIVLEDDMVTSPYFLRFMNDALEFYRDEERVISIHGYTPPLNVKLPETFFLKGADCWGWATWQRGWELFEPDGKHLLDVLERASLVHEFNYDGFFDYRKMLQAQTQGKISSWAIRWYASAFVKNRLTLYPGSSLVLNIGNDKSGTHCGSTDVFTTGLADAPVPIKAIPVEEDPLCRKEMGRFLNFSASGLVKNTLRKLKAALKG